MKFTSCWSPGSLFNIPLLLHWSLPIPFVLFTLEGLITNGWPKGAGALVAIPLAFLIVTLHELGHCTAAKLLKIPVISITLTGIGGIALIKPKPDERPSRSLVVTLCGPLVNLLLLTLGSCTLGIPTLPWIQGFQENPFGSWQGIYAVAFVINICIILFNLLPVYPLDGGRMLKELGEICGGKRIGAILAIAGCLAVGFPAVFFLAKNGDYLAASIILSAIFLGILENYSNAKKQNHEH